MECCGTLLFSEPVRVKVVLVYSGPILPFSDIKHLEIVVMLYIPWYFIHPESFRFLARMESFTLLNPLIICF